MGLPFLRIEFTGVDASVLPTERSARVVEDALETEFPPGPTAPIIVAGRRRRAGPGGGDGLRRRPVAARRRRVGERAGAGGRVLADRRRARGRRAVGLGEAAGGGRARRAGAVPGPGHGRHGRVPRPAVVARATRCRSALVLLTGSTLVILFLMTGLGRAAGQGADHEPAHAQRRVRPARADLPGRPAGGAARLRCAGRAGVHPADPAVRRRLRALDRLRRVPAHAHQGGARRRGGRPRGGGRSGSSGPAGSSPTRRCCSASRSARSPRPRWCSSRSSGSAPRWPC